MMHFLRHDYTDTGKISQYRIKLEGDEAIIQQARLHRCTGCSKTQKEWTEQERIPVKTFRQALNKFTEVGAQESIRRIDAYKTAREEAREATRAQNYALDDALYMLDNSDSMEEAKEKINNLKKPVDIKN